MRQTNNLLELIYFLKENGYNYVVRSGFIEIIVDNGLTDSNKIIHLDNNCKISR
jgi:hypothetical protein